MKPTAPLRDHFSEYATTPVTWHGIDGAIPLTSKAALKSLNRLVGTWTTEPTHPSVHGVIVLGTAIIEWLEGERFPIHRARTYHPDFPDAISIIGFTERDRV